MGRRTVAWVRLLVDVGVRFCGVCELLLSCKFTRLRTLKMFVGVVGDVCGDANGELRRLAMSSMRFRLRWNSRCRCSISLGPNWRASLPTRKIGRVGRW